MKEFIIEENEAGQRFDKYLAKLLKEAPQKEYHLKRKKSDRKRETHQGRYHQTVPERRYL